MRILPILLHPQIEDLWILPILLHPQIAERMTRHPRILRMLPQPTLNYNTSSSYLSQLLASVSKLITYLAVKSHFCPSHLPSIYRNYYSTNADTLTPYKGARTGSIWCHDVHRNNRWPVMTKSRSSCLYWLCEVTNKGLNIMRSLRRFLDLSPRLAVVAAGIWKCY
jgi:hypothetical protein